MAGMLRNFQPALKNVYFKIKRRINRLIIGQLNINTLRNKSELLSIMINGNIDTFIISETKLDKTFPAALFSLQGFCEHYRFDRDRNGVVELLRGQIVYFVNKV